MRCELKDRKGRVIKTGDLSDCLAYVPNNNERFFIKPAEPNEMLSEIETGRENVLWTWAGWVKTGGVPLPVAVDRLLAIPDAWSLSVMTDDGVEVVAEDKPAQYYTAKRLAGLKAANKAKRNGIYGYRLWSGHHKDEIELPTCGVRQAYYLSYYDQWIDQDGEWEFAENYWGSVIGDPDCVRSLKQCFCSHYRYVVTNELGSPVDSELVSV